jgi:hypothetical protein
MKGTETNRGQANQAPSEATCCSTEALEVCCAPEEKTLCCGAEPKKSASGCGCR